MASVSAGLLINNTHAKLGLFCRARGAEKKYGFDEKTCARVQVGVASQSERTESKRAHLV